MKNEIVEMTIKEAIKERHMVRKYTDKAIPSDLVQLLDARLEETNKANDLNIKLITGKSDGLSSIAKLLLAKGVNNYIVLAGPDRADLDEKLGYYGADIMLYAQTLGLNSWWVGGMFNPNGAKSNLENKSVRINGIIAIGYGQTNGVQHKMKTADQISSYEGETPRWFAEGVEALLYAPAALNKMAFTVKGSGNKVSITCDSGHFSGIDLGIGKYHFEVGAGRDNFEWI